MDVKIILHAQSKMLPISIFWEVFGLSKTIHLAFFPIIDYAYYENVIKLDLWGYGQTKAK